MRYHLEDLVALIDQPNQDICAKILAENAELFAVAPGASHNHQAWPGGYHDHVTEVMNIALFLYKAFSDRRPLPFSKSDALLVLFLHDLEKPWRALNPALATKESRRRFREEKLGSYGIQLTPSQANACKYVEGEGDDYSPNGRVMNELAAFCHMCDVASARLWPEMPAVPRDPWPGARRVSKQGVE